MNPDNRIKDQYLANLFTFCENHGVKKELVLSNIEPSKPLEKKDVDLLWRNASSLTNVEHIGLEVGSMGNLTALGLVGSLIENSESIREALQMGMQFMALVTDTFTMELRESQKKFTIVFHPNPECQEKYSFGLRHTIDSAVVFSWLELRWLGIESVYPTRVCFNYKKPENFDLYRKIFRAPIRFGQKEVSISFPSIILNKIIAKADYTLHAIFLDLAIEKLKALKPGRKWSNKVTEIIINNYNLEFPPLSRVASQLNISERQLQRKLRDESTNFQKIVDIIKKDLACSYLSRSDSQILDIACMLGYTEPSAFTRSFTRWTGLSPSVFREREIRK